MTTTLTKAPSQADQLAAYSEAFDDAWQALEAALVSLGKLNDCLYQGEALVMRAPAADVSLMRDAIKNLRTELQCFENAKEPSRLSPILPGEIRYEM